MAKWRNETFYDSTIFRVASRFKVPVDIVKGVIAAESGFNSLALGDNGRAYGLMQLLDTTARGLGFRGADNSELFDPTTNIEFGTELLAQLYDRAGNWDGAISAYNGGYRPHLGFGEPVKRQGVRCMSREVPIGEYCNQEYVDRVNRYRRYFVSGVETAGFANIGALPMAILALGLLIPLLLRKG